MLLAPLDPALPFFIIQRTVTVASIPADSDTNIGMPLFKCRITAVAQPLLMCGCIKMHGVHDVGKHSLTDRQLQDVYPGPNAGNQPI
jgi:hypothetical protein